MSYTVYKIVGPNGKMYFGHTKDLVNRKSTHKYMSKISNHKMYLDMRTIGFEKFLFSIVSVHESKLEAIKNEEFWINDLSTNVNGYNISSGGIGPSYKFSEERKLAISIEIKQRYFDKEYKDKMKIVRKNVFRSDLQSKKGVLGAQAKINKFKEFFILDLKTNQKHGPFKTVKNAAESLKVGIDKLNHHISGRTKNLTYKKLEV